MVPNAEVVPGIVSPAQMLRDLADQIENGEWGDFNLMAVTFRGSRVEWPSVVCWGERMNFTAGDVEDMLSDAADVMCVTEEDEIVEE